MQFADDEAVIFQIPTSEGEQYNFLGLVPTLSIDFGELASDVLVKCNAERLPRSKKRKTLSKARSALGKLVLLINDLQHHITGIQPLLQSSSELFLNGDPMVLSLR